MTPKWAQDLIIDACLYLGLEDIPVVDWRHRKAKSSSGRAWYPRPPRNEGRIIINAGSDRTDCRLTILHELAHIRQPKGHTDAFWAVTWDLIRWAKLPIRYCLQRETEYRKGAAAAYHRSK
jgi:hypothetical protein